MHCAQGALAADMPLPTASSLHLTAHPTATERLTVLPILTLVPDLNSTQLNRLSGLLWYNLDRLTCIGQRAIATEIQPSLVNILEPNRPSHSS